MKTSKYRGKEYLSGKFHDIAQAMDVEDPYVARDIIICMMRDMELNNPDSINLEEDLNILSKSVNPVRLKNNPVGIDEETAYSLYSKILVNTN